MMVFQELVLRFDKPIFFFFQNLQNHGLDLFLARPTRLGETLLVETFLLLGIFIFDRTKKLQNMAVAAAGILITQWASQYLKEWFHRPRPFLVWPETHVLFGKPYNDAFPSGHTAIAFAAAFLLDRFYPGKMRWTYALAALVGITRIYIGVHYPTDVIGGALTGMACAALACKVLTPSSKN